jgi:hypothetical protein
VDVVAAGEDTNSALGAGFATDPDQFTDVTLVEIDQGDPPALARLADALYHWRYGLVMLSPLIIGALAYGYVKQAAPPPSMPFEVESAESGLDPLISGVAGQSARSGAAVPVVEPVTESTIVIRPSEPTDGVPAGVGDDHGNDHGNEAAPASPGVDDQGSPNVAERRHWWDPARDDDDTDGRSSPDWGSEGSGTQAQVDEADSSPTWLPHRSASTTTPSRGLVCTLEIGDSQPPLYKKSDDSSKVLTTVDAGTYLVVDTDDDETGTWYLVASGDLNGWVSAQDLGTLSPRCR